MLFCCVIGFWDGDREYRVTGKRAVCVRRCLEHEGVIFHWIRTSFESRREPSLTDGRVRGTNSLTSEISMSTGTNSRFAGSDCTHCFTSNRDSIFRVVSWTRANIKQRAWPMSLLEPINHPCEGICHNAPSMFAS